MSPELLVGILVSGVVAYFVFPGIGRSVGPLLILAACPLSMLGMMVMMGRGPEKNAVPADSHAGDVRDAELSELRSRLARLEGTDTPMPGRG